MKTISQAAFARMHEVSRKTITVWKASGLIVMSGNAVDVEASNARLKRFRSGRHQKARAPVSIAESCPRRPSRSPLQHRLPGGNHRIRTAQVLRPVRAVSSRHYRGCSPLRRPRSVYRPSRRAQSTRRSGRCSCNARRTCSTYIVSIPPSRVRRSRGCAGPCGRNVARIRLAGCIRRGRGFAALIATRGSHAGRCR